MRALLKRLINVVITAQPDEISMFAHDI
ncbi:MAG TPA: hypothetical protein DEP08_02800 [Candidatus Jacksonbacteria bacterium]|nr:hypothetical protein [Candidatus Jacksonbacteria bacterium]HCE86701.1 hypothetical protein [Candidatus Jacksonbacteria bacterium]